MKTRTLMIAVMVLLLATGSALAQMGGWGHMGGGNGLGSGLGHMGSGITLVPTLSPATVMAPAMAMEWGESEA